MEQPFSHPHNMDVTWTFEKRKLQKLVEPKPDPYKEIAEVVPYAINRQIKESDFWPGSEVPTDYNLLIQILKDGGYEGYLLIETLWVHGKPFHFLFKIEQCFAVGSYLLQVLLMYVYI